MSYSILNDDSVDTVLFRNPEFRLSFRQRDSVEEWLRSHALLHCMRDPSLPGLFAIKLQELRRTKAVFEILLTLIDKELAQEPETQKQNLEYKIWREFNALFLCHDLLPGYGNGSDYVNGELEAELKDSRHFLQFYEGQRFNEHMEPSDIKYTGLVENS